MPNRIHSSEITSRWIGENIHNWIVKVFVHCTIRKKNVTRAAARMFPQATSCCLGISQGRSGKCGEDVMLIWRKKKRPVKWSLVQNRCNIRVRTKLAGGQRRKDDYLRHDGGFSYHFLHWSSSEACHRSRKMNVLWTDFTVRSLAQSHCSLPEMWWICNVHDSYNKRQTFIIFNS